jgi:hypothetical protein
MKVIGIEIDKKRAICFAIKQDSNGEIAYLNGNFKYLELNDDLSGEELRNFQSDLFTFFDSMDADRIAIVSRQTKGKFAAASVSFKLEGLIQCYEKVDIEFVSKQALAAYFKKNEMKVVFNSKYQENAGKLAAYLLGR